MDEFQGQVKKRERGEKDEECRKFWGGDGSDDVTYVKYKRERGRI